ncbi:hypothetical protein TBLA_0A03880 [Henningerozyma blattae CBS 6284]|uniref:Acyl-protein thioesterase 1 n=1 Tax=Henningerozyma blattae (strain ATCC 34711 / CBS 6284 / DSM 70876 / NBRC 10599 / NRRL Y-10934 / UCD 77-7) TaxID=1071380 RepID=I2GVN4_HENB6|nr:hypothetical protein TBLA_0A03880 [Tetrapisispora blattae CBS 6284]CCH58186.1 hypothetical protein TBLA_0A03880 [Tetrapisispora blattae CBS 6284]
MSHLSAVRVAAKALPAKNAIIVFHGLGDTGSGWSFLSDYLVTDSKFNHTNFVFPNAPNMPVLANGNMIMPSWFNIKDWNITHESIDSEDFSKSLGIVETYVKEQIDSGIEPSNIILGGFSQGAALVLASSLVLKYKIGGFFALSGFSGLSSETLTKMKNDNNINTPIFHGHGDADPIVPFEVAKHAEKVFSEEYKLNYKFHEYPGMGHTTCPDELNEVVSFIRKCLIF